MMATSVEFLGRDGAEQLVATVKNLVNEKASKSEATHSTAGLMSAADKIKLDSLSNNSGSGSGSSSGSGSTAGSVLYTEQELTNEQQTQARTNIGAVSESELFEYFDSGDTITWNGTLDGLDVWVEMYEGDYGMEEGDTYCKLSDISQTALDTIIDQYMSETLTVSAIDNAGNEIMLEIGGDHDVGYVEFRAFSDTVALFGYIVTERSDFWYEFPSAGIWVNYSMGHRDEDGNLLGYVASITFDGISLVQKKLINSDLLQINLSGLDSSMSDTSENPVKNKVIKAYIDNLIGAAISASY